MWEQEKHLSNTKAHTPHSHRGTGDLLVCLHLITHTPLDRFPCTFMTPSMLFCVHPSCVSVFLKDVWFVVTSLVSSHWFLTSKALPYKLSLYRLALASGTPRTHFGTIVESDMPLGILGCFAAWGMIDVPPVIECQMISEKGKATLPPQSHNYVLSSDAPIMIFRGRFRYRFFSSKLADSDSDTDFFSFKQPTRNNERF